MNILLPDLCLPQLFNSKLQTNLQCFLPVMTGQFTGWDNIYGVCQSKHVHFNYHDHTQYESQTESQTDIPSL